MKNPKTTHKSTINPNDNWKLWNQATTKSPIAEFLLQSQETADAVSAFHNNLSWTRYYNLYLKLHPENKLLAIHKAKSHAVLERISKLRDQQSNSDEFLIKMIPSLKILVSIHEYFKIDSVDDLRKTLDMLRSTSLNQNSI